MKRPCGDALLLAAIGGVLPAQFAGDPAFALLGNVTDVLGHAVPAARVTVLDDYDVRHAAVATDAEGRFQVSRLPNGVPLRVRVVAADRVPTELVIRDGGAARGITVVLEDGESRRGRVTGPGGSPIAGAVVLAWASPNAMDDTLPVRVEAEANANGDYTLHGVPLRACSVLVFAPGCASQRRDLPRVDGAGWDFELAEAARPGRMITLSGLDAAGIASARFRITLHPHGSPSWLPTAVRSGAFDRAGIARSWSMPGEFAVSVVVPGHDVQPAWRCCRRDDAEPVAFTARPRVVTTRFSGRILDRNGAPVAVGFVLCKSRGGQLVGQAVVGVDGRFAFVVPLPDEDDCSLGLAEGTYRFAEEGAGTRCDGRSWCDAVISAGTERSWIVATAAAIHGVLRDEHGVPLSCRPVVVTGHGDQVYTATDGNGAFLAGGLAGGDYVVRTSDHRGRPAVVEITVANGERIDVGALTFAEVGCLEGVLRGPRGPLAGVRVSVGHEHRVLTDRRGRFRVSALAVGTVEVAAPGCGVMSCDIRRGSVTAVELQHP